MLCSALLFLIDLFWMQGFRGNTHCVIILLASGMTDDGLASDVGD